MVIPAFYFKEERNKMVTIKHSKDNFVETESAFHLLLVQQSLKKKWTTLKLIYDHFRTRGLIDNI